MDIFVSPLSAVLVLS